MRRLAQGAALAALLALPGCGYSLVGKGMHLDPSIHRIGVPIFKDQTGRPGLDQVVTEKVVEELMRKGHFEVVTDSSNVDASVEGEILTYRAVPIGFSQLGLGSSASTQATRYAIVMTVKVAFKRTGDTEDIWSTDSLSAREESDVGDNPSAYFDRSDQAVDRLATSFARSLVAAMFEAF